MKLAIVIVHYNTSADLERCLASVRDNPPAGAHEVVVVDNASRDPGLPEVRRRHPEVHWLLGTENVGYARGVNRGLAAVAAAYYLVLNPDVVVRPGALDALLAFAEAHPRAGLVGPQLLNEDGSVQDSCRRFYTFGTLLLRRTFLGRLFPRSRLVARHLMRDFDHRSARPVDWVLGGCVLARREAVEKVGPLDERFFLYFEDVDWCYRMWQGGWEVLYTPDAHFVHRHRRESARGALHPGFWRHLGSLISFYEKWGMLVYLLKKWRGPLSVLALWLLDMAGLGVAFAAAWGLRAAADPLFAEPVYPLAEYRPLLLFAMLLASLTFLTAGRYRPGRARAPGGAAAHLRLVAVVGLLLVASTYLSRQEVVSRVVLLLLLPLFALTSALVGRLYAGLRRRMERGWLSLERTLLVGEADEVAAWLADVPQPHRLGIDPVGYATFGEAPRGPLAAGRVPWLGPWSEAEALVERYRVGQIAFWRTPAATAADQLRLARLRGRRVRLRWRVDEAWLVAAGARSERFGGADSAVLDPPAGPGLGGLACRATDLAAGLLLAVVTLPARLWAALLGPGRVPARELAGHGPLGRPLHLRLAVRPDGRVRPLWVQWPLAGALLAGRVGLLGPRLATTPAAGAAPAEAPRFWQVGRRRPGLSGGWAGAGALAQLRTLLRDPLGVGRLVAAEPVPDRVGAEIDPRREVHR